MFEDKKFNKIDVKLLEMESQPLGEGGFGAVYKTKYHTVLYIAGDVIDVFNQLLNFIFASIF